MLVGCQGSYPLPPTVCDDWCDVVPSLDCITQNPAACVASCEQEGYSSAMCEPAAKAVITCLRMQPRIHSLCENDPQTSTVPCLEELDVAANCASAYEQAKGRLP